MDNQVEGLPPVAMRSVSINHGFATPVLTSEEQSAVATMLDMVVADVASWCAARPPMDAANARRLTLLMCVQFPNLGPTETALRVKLIIWIFALDDLLDDPQTLPDLALTVVQDCSRVALGGGSGLTALGEVLGEIRQDLMAYPLFSEAQPTWVVTVTRLLDGMMFEYWWQIRRRNPQLRVSLPSLGEYLSYGKHSIGLPVTWITSAIVSGDRLIVNSMGILLEIAEKCGEAMRLMNDISSIERECSEGEFNSLHIIRELVKNEPSNQWDVENNYAYNLIDSIVSESKLLASSAVSVQSIADRFVRSTIIGINMYAMSDFRD